MNAFELANDGLKCIPSLWFPDGNIIIQADATCYRLYQGILAQQSAYFGRILAPGEAEKLPVVDGCRLVRLEDGVQDVTPFLKALFDSSFFEAPGTPTTLTLISHVLRLSLKYEVPFLTRRCLSHFDSAYPTTLAGWRKRERIRTIPPVDNTPFAVLLLSLELPIPWILPAIYYCLCTHPLMKTLNGVTWEGQQLDLIWPQIKTCVAGRSKLIHTQFRYAVQFVSEGDVAEEEGRCETPHFCRGIRKHALDLIVDWETMGYFDLVDENSQMFKGLCAECRKGFLGFFARTTKEMWDKLPGLFGLPAWKELEEMRIRTISRS
ncbi:hypothetical protein BDN72DRAFT_849592 [Pluteus cervinus]|uniref:Uncharacterized protein n=1 Tax=Pluteus cervinus TaxID=181527 RepID=A0ACD3A753_9AGAR|nr:hypothetical protein BDN72DRAFT_849592 [Pluteus cervinus]